MSHKDSSGEDMRAFENFADNNIREMIADIDKMNGVRTPVAPAVAETTVSATAPAKRGGKLLKAGASLMLAAGLVATPQVREAARDVVAHIVENNRAFNPEQGNPENAKEIVESWDRDPNETYVQTQDGTLIPQSDIDAANAQWQLEHPQDVITGAEAFDALSAGANQSSPQTAKGGQELTQNPGS